MSVSSQSRGRPEVDGRGLISHTIPSKQQQQQQHAFVQTLESDSGSCAEVRVQVNRHMCVENVDLDRVAPIRGIHAGVLHSQAGVLI